MAETLVDTTRNGFLDTVLHYGLFVGAIFQLICILAVIFVPSKDDEKVEEGETCSQAQAPPNRQNDKARKMEKKKRR